MTIAYALGAPVMMQLGVFQFGINTAAYQGLSRSDSWRWPAQERIGQEAALQHVGPEATSISLDGVIFPEWRGGLGQLDAMRAQAARGEPLVLVNGLGQALGMWVIERIDENQSTFAGGGIARRIEFSMQLRRFSEAVTGPVPQLPPLPVPRPPASGETTAQRAGSLADTVTTAAAPLLDGARSALRQLQEKVAPAASMLQEAADAAQRVADVAADLQATAGRARSLLKHQQDDAGAARIAAMLGTRGMRLRGHAESAERVLRRLMTQVEAVPDEVVRAMTGAAECAGKLGALCRTTYIEADRISEVQP